MTINQFQGSQPLQGGQSSQTGQPNLVNQQIQPNQLNQPVKMSFADFSANAPVNKVDSITPLGTSFLGSAVSGIAKSGLNTLKNISTLGEGMLQAPLKAIGMKFPQQSSAEQLQSAVEKAKGITPGTLLQPANQTESGFKLGTDISQFFIPGGLEKAATEGIDAALNAPKIAEIFGSKAPLVTNLLKTVAGGGITGTSMAGVTAAEGGSKQDIQNAGITGALTGAVSKAFSIYAPGILKSLAKGSLKMSGSVASKAAPKADAAATFIVDNGLSFNPAKQYEQSSKIITNFEKTMQSNLTDKFGVSPEELKANITKIVDEFKTDQAFYQSVKSAAVEANKTIDEINTPNANITLNELLSGKRSYGEMAFGKSQAVKTTGVISKADFAIEQAYQDTLSSALQKTKGDITVPKELQQYFGGKTNVSLEEFNKVYSQVTNVNKFSNIARNKKDTQLMGRLFGLWAGRAIGTAIGGPGLPAELIGATAGELTASHLPGLLRQTTGAVLRRPNALTTAAKVATPLLRSINQ